MADSTGKPLSFAGLKCLKCDYDLAGLPEGKPRCPECGAAFDPANYLKHARRLRRRQWLISAAMMLPAYYGPYSWLLIIDYPWGEYRWLWVKMWPGLPMLLIMSLIGVRDLLVRWFNSDLDETLGMTLMTALSLALLAGLIWLGRRGRWTLWITATIVLALSSANAWILHSLFLM